MKENLYPGDNKSRAYYPRFFQEHMPVLGESYHHQFMQVPFPRIGYDDINRQVYKGMGSTSTFRTGRLPSLNNTISNAGMILTTAMTR